jgi:hypothetical protein
MSVQNGLSPKYVKILQIVERCAVLSSMHQFYYFEHGIIPEYHWPQDDIDIKYTQSLSLDLPLFIEKKNIVASACCDILTFLIPLKLKIYRIGNFKFACVITDNGKKLPLAFKHFDETDSKKYVQ